ncbi:DUF4276 family protein [Gemmatimonas sp.]|uniref:DUF4276 family protein n=1 Tax=Gemmatimonas sp. TaxID=1962908 RepID=UPI00286CD890|nr:DUF4276 family protein [Gemmatimonas sp.]
MLILVEGQTEERFVKTILGPWLLSAGVIVAPTILVTKRASDGKRFKGGVSSYAKFRTDVQRLIGSRGGAYVTTLLDYYGLPSDFPGMLTRPQGSTVQRVEFVEHAIAADFGNPADFRPFLALHEFEAWLFASETALPDTLEPEVDKDKFAAICQSFSTPEDINERPTLAPSKRIVSLAPGYRKALHGPVIAERIGLQTIRDKCPHAAKWFADLESFAGR